MEQDNKRGQSQRWERRFEIIMRRDGERVEGLLVNLSNMGMEIRTRYRFDTSDEVSIRIITPDGERFHYLSEVRWWRPVHGLKMGQGQYRFGMLHLAVDPEHNRLMEMVCYDPFRRIGGKRVEVELPVAVESGSDLGPLMTHNISTGGLFIRLPHLPPPYREDVMTLSIQLDPEKKIRAKAQVVHLLQPSWATRLELASGVGLRFLEVSPEDREVLFAFLREKGITEEEISAARDAK